MNWRGWRNILSLFFQKLMLVKAVKYDVIRLERLKNEPERMEEYLNFKKGSTQKPLQNIQGVQFLFFEPIPICPIFKLKPPLF